MSLTGHVKVAIVGSGPAGIGAALRLARRGISPIALIERNSEIGGIPAQYKDESLRTFVLWTKGRMESGRTFIERLARKIEETDVRIWLESQVLEVDPENKALTMVNPQKGKFTITADAIILACGGREKTLAERGWIAGSRTGRVLFTHHLLELLNRNEVLVARQAAVIGSDLIAYAAAAKLKKAGTSEVTLIDSTRKPKCSLFERFYFRRWVNPRWIGSVKSALLTSNDSLEVETGSGKRHIIACDSVIVSGELVSNSELPLLGSLDVDLTSRCPKVNSNHELSASGWFIAGNMLGGFHGAQWCYWDGLETGKSVGKYLEKSSQEGE